MYLWPYGLLNTWLDKCLKSPISEDPSTSEKVKGPKPCENLYGSTFTIFIDPCKRNPGWKFVTRFLDATISETKNIFLFFWPFVNLNLILNICKKKITLIADIFPNLRTPKDLVR